MQIKNTFLTELSKTATGFVGGIWNIKKEIEATVTSKVDSGISRYIKSKDLVSRQEFLLLKEMLVKTRKENEDLQRRIQALEGRDHD